jgi:hypothetical protein
MEAWRVWSRGQIVVSLNYLMKEGLVFEKLSPPLNGRIEVLSKGEDIYQPKSFNERSIGAGTMDSPLKWKHEGSG